MFKLNQWEFCLGLRKMELLTNLKQRQPSVTMVIFIYRRSFPSTHAWHPESVHVTCEKLGFIPS